MSSLADIVTSVAAKQLDLGPMLRGARDLSPLLAAYRVRINLPDLIASQRGIEGHR